MTKRHNRPERIENKARAQKAVNIQLAQKLDSGDPPLIRTVYVLLKSTPNVFKDLVNDGDGKGRSIPLQVIGQHSQQADIAVPNLPGFGEDLVQNTAHVGVIPVQLSKELEHFVDGLLAQDVVD
jgi:hypothetical protein